MPNEEKRPEWVPENAGQEFTTIVRPGVENLGTAIPHRPQRRELSISEYVEGILNHNRTILARAITLIESNLPKHLEMSQQILTQILPFTGKSIRIGISGVPGAGKSTFIESLGCYLTQNNHTLAVLTIDPSSTISKGSVLGDKTRMEKLVQQQNCFIRPSPSSGALGGVNRKTRETMLICEAAGYEIIIVETVGVGQSEIQVRTMVDFFLLLNIANAGDELQGIKKGIMEIADAIAINKCDGQNISASILAKAEYSQALQYISPFTPNWKPKVHLCSSLLGEGIPEIWQEIQYFITEIKKNNYFQTRRRQQMQTWIHQLVEEYLHNLFYRNPKILEILPKIEQAVWDGVLSPTNAALQMIEILEQKK